MYGGSASRLDSEPAQHTSMGEALTASGATEKGSPMAPTCPSYYDGYGRSGERG